MQKSIDITNVEFHNKPLWCIYGPKSFPTIICCKVVPFMNELNIWGYSVWKDEPGFRTLGISVKEFIKTREKPIFFDNQDDALKRLKKITTPKGFDNPV